MAGGTNTVSNSAPKNEVDDSADTSTTNNPPERNGGMRLRRSTRSDFNLEPNPFEQSFRTPHSSNLRQGNDGRSPSPNHRDSTGPSSNGSGKLSDGNKQSKDKSETPPPVLPPVATIASPADPNHFGSWGFSPSLANSLRSGPLSPAMLAGPQMGGYVNLNYDQSSFRTGFTPRTGLTPRTGMTPSLGSGLTPLMGGPVSFPPPSPNTAAFLALMNSNNNNMHSSSSNLQPSTTITPNTFSAITGGAFNPSMMNKNGNEFNSTNNNQDQQQPSQTQQSAAQTQAQTESNAAAAASYAASTAADGLFLLSQAHQELTKRDEAARAANAVKETAPPRAPGNRKRKSSTATAPAKRTRTSTRARVSPDYEEDDDDDSVKEFSMKDAKGETEEEKRKNFLERNRQAALKCRQRKKAWLAQLQGQNEYLKAENERLTSALVAAREEVARLSALSNPGPSKTTQGQPVSVNVPVGKNGATTNGAGARGGYGY